MDKNNAEQKDEQQDKHPSTPLDFEYVDSPEKNQCRAVACTKNIQQKTDGFCTSHYHRYLIGTGKCGSWHCPCGNEILDVLSRCGTCRKWRDGKRQSSKKSKSKSKLKSKSKEGREQEHEQEQPMQNAVNKDTKDERGEDVDSAPNNPGLNNGKDGNDNDDKPLTVEVADTTDVDPPAKGTKGQNESENEWRVGKKQSPKELKEEREQEQEQEQPMQNAMNVDTKDERGEEAAIKEDVDGTPNNPGLKNVKDGNDNDDKPLTVEVADTTDVDPPESGTKGQNESKNELPLPVTPTTISSSTAKEETVENNKKKKKKKKENSKADNQSSLEFTWICTECREAECFGYPDAPLLICDGKCNRPFHPPCANVITLPPEDEPWICADCKQNRHQCVVCKEFGEDDVDVFCCDAKGCGLFFHENCLDMYNVNVQLVEEEIPVDSGEEPNEDGATTKIVSRPKFRCPAHECWTCSGGAPPQEMNVVDNADAAAMEESTSPASGKKKGNKRGKKRKSADSAMLWGAKKERLFRCLDCPISYHITCMPPSCRFHELAMLCHEHSYTSKLPYLDAEYSIQACVEAEADKKIEALRRKEERRAANLARGAAILGSDDDEEGAVVVYDGSDEEENPFLPGLVGSAVIFEEEQLAEFLDRENDESNGKRKKRRQFSYCLPCDFKELVHSKPPAYTHVNMNRYDPRNRPKRHPPNGESCTCKPSTEDGSKSCGDRCLNRLSYVECVGNQTLKSGDKNPYWNCNCGTNCGNRAMSQRQFAKCRPAREHGKGWGLITINGVKKGDLVQEYAGEIIDAKTKEERLKSWSTDHPNDPNFYVMHLEPGWYIDAREVANQARFINHSCDPNCKLVPVNVAGHIRVSIVCIKDVPPGGFLSYDYKFDTQHGEKFICRCGAENCCGTMEGAGKIEEKIVEKKTKKQLLLEAKARVQRDKKFLQGVIASEKERLYLTGPFVPGVDAEKAEMVAGGPQERYRNEARGIFLWRNAVAGADFSSRYWRYVARKKGVGKQMQNLISQCGQLDPVDVVSLVKG
mmetsp:Transcript_38508/g.81016  ORF Transcript_38508/g.81016 Transcript_38508/m.81016 type:complete len:1036 (-) Transcript_38508:287-3394(-)